MGLLNTLTPQPSYLIASHSSDIQADAQQALDQGWAKELEVRRANQKDLLSQAISLENQQTLVKVGKWTAFAAGCLTVALGTSGTVAGALPWIGCAALFGAMGYAQYKDNQMEKEQVTLRESERPHSPRIMELQALVPAAQVTHEVATRALAMGR